MNNWDNGYIIRSFTNQYVRFEGSPSVNNLFKDALMEENSTKAYVLLKGLSVRGKTYIILTEHDYKVIIFQRGYNEKSELYKLMSGTSEGFNLYYYSKTPYNWIRIWGEK